MPFRFVVANQKGGVAKTSTAITVARHYRDLGYRVLLVDCDPQGGISSILNFERGTSRLLSNFLVGGFRLEDCITEAVPGLHVLGGDRSTAQAEGVIKSEQGSFPGLSFITLFTPYEGLYDVMVFDVAPSISLLQTCAMLYARNVLIPVDMDSQASVGAVAALGACIELTEKMHALGSAITVQALGLVPVMVDRRFRLTEQTLEDIHRISEKYQVPILQAVRTDITVRKANKAHEFLVDYDGHKRSNALQDYAALCEQIRAMKKDEFAAHAEVLSQTA